MWCPKCHYGSESAKFALLQKCPQCGTVNEVTWVDNQKTHRQERKVTFLTKNPFSTTGGRTLRFRDAAVAKAAEASNETADDQKATP